MDNSVSPDNPSPGQIVFSLRHIVLMALLIGLLTGLASGHANAGNGDRLHSAYPDYFFAGRAMLAQGKQRPALQFLAADMAIRPQARTAEIYLTTLIGQHCFDWDSGHFTALLPLLPDQPQLLECLGRLHEGRSDFSGAERMYRQWAASHPENAEPHARLGELYFFTKQYDKALAAFSHHRNLIGDSHYALRRMARAAALQVSPPYAQVASHWFRENRGKSGPGGGIWETGRWQDDARQGDATAQYNMGMITFHGWGGTPDPDAALDWFRQSAAQGDTRAMLALSRACLNGDGMAQDLAQGFRWANQAAQHRDGQGQMLLGTLLAYGIGTPANRMTAMDSYHGAALNFIGQEQSGWAESVLLAMHQVAPQHHLTQRLQSTLNATYAEAGGTP